ncbi:serine protease gd-like [Neocloeon triangulifer]|uniref:serine protease gd-like n=1 Tax=Neocloeon triangulifer TaxID=2078957 RepID=UPI00286FA595|nr:serine protease gd-like [Neocloeon triangulifer]XP_059481298.1 serine protease gd-like [Neocloeon triangulifer]XP_059481299.1 serine protease gd-like [Neocloeon triangulifer]
MWPLLALITANNLLGTDCRRTFHNNNPCLNYFNYDADLSGGELQVPPPENISKVNLIVNIMVHEKIDTSYVGKISIAENVNSVFRRLKNNNRSPIKFQVHFPVRSPIPYLTSVSVNGKSVCNYEPVDDPAGHFTSIKLGYDLFYGPKEETSNKNQELPFRNQFDNDEQYQPAPIIQTTTCAPPPKCTCTTPRPVFCPPAPPPTRCPPVPPPTRCPPIDFSLACPAAEEEEDPEIEFLGCGKSSSTKIPIQLIVNGENIAKGSYPWLSAIYENNERGPQFVCSGTLISKKHVITAAHCVSNYQKQNNVKNYVVFLGKHNIFSFTEKEATAKDVEKITNHPGYAWNTGVDLAIITLKTEVRFNAYIRPVCLWYPNRGISDTGQVIGWGRDELGNSLTSTPKEIEMSVRSDFNCNQDSDIAKLMTNLTLCAGSQQNGGGGPCKGDSGGGLYIRSAQSKRWYIRGIVSQAVWDRNQNSCDPSKNVVFTDISKTWSWIVREISLDHTDIEIN